MSLRIRALNSYMEYRQASITPVSMIKIQQKTYLDKIISQADYEYLKRCLAESEEYTYYFIVRLITATGVRISELITFQIEDVHTGHKDIYSKGNEKIIYKNKAKRSTSLYEFLILFSKIYLTQKLNYLINQ